jgi:hypothetical protein
LIAALALMILAPIAAQLLYFAILQKREIPGLALRRSLHPLPGGTGLGAGEAGLFDEAD